MLYLNLVKDNRTDEIKTLLIDLTDLEKLVTKVIDTRYYNEDKDSAYLAAHRARTLATELGITSISYGADIQPKVGEWVIEALDKNYSWQFAEIYTGNAREACYRATLFLEDYSRVRYQLKFANVTGWEYLHRVEPKAVYEHWRLEGEQIDNKDAWEFLENIEGPQSDVVKETYSYLDIYKRVRYRSNLTDGIDWVYLSRWKIEGVRRECTKGELEAVETHLGTEESVIERTKELVKEYRKLCYCEEAKVNDVCNWTIT